jgi:hypothetical protein
MAHPLTLPMTAVLALVGAGLGIHLGHSAIAEINPAYYNHDDERASKFYADLAPGKHDWAAVQVSELRAAETGEQLLYGCVGCTTYPEEYHPIHEASLGKVYEGLAETTETPAEAAAPAVMASAAHFEQVERYARYPVSAEEPQQTASAEVALPDSADGAVQ